DVGQAAVPQLHVGAHDVEGHQIGSVGGVGSDPVVVQHPVGVAVVGGDEGHAAHLGGGLHHLAHALVHGLHGLHSGVKHAGVTHHVAVGEVEDDDVVLAALDALNGLLGDLGGAHRGLQVIGRHLGRGDQAPVLAGEYLLGAADEEERHMGILLGIGDAQLGVALAGNVLAKDVLQLPVGEGNEHIGHGSIILGGADVSHGEVTLLPLHVGEGGVHKAAGDLPGPVGAEV